MTATPQPERMPDLPLDVAIREYHGMSDREIAQRREAVRRAREQNPGPIRRLVRKLRRVSDAGR